LALPYALKQAGLVWGGILMIVSAISTLYSLQLLVTACHVLQEYTYEGIVQQVLGKRARNITEVSILLFCVGVAVAYIIAVGDILESLQFKRKSSMVLVWVTMMFPLSLLKTMTSLQAASGVGIFSIGLLVVVAIIHLLLLQDSQHDSQHESPSLESLLWPTNGVTSVLTACPLVLFAFSCQVNVCAIYQELDNKRHMNRVLVVAVTVCAILYTAISLAAYLDFSNQIQPNVLQNYCPNTPLIQMAFLGMTVAVVMAFPLNIFPTRVTLEGLYEKQLQQQQRSRSEVELASSAGTSGDEPLLLLPRSYYDGNNNDNDEDVPFHWWSHFFITLAICGVTLLLALVAPNISVVFGLLGGTTSSILGFILPGLVGMKVDSHPGRARMLVVAGVVVGILTTAVTVYSTFAPTAPPASMSLLDGAVAVVVVAEPQASNGMATACNVSASWN
jgi:amino acid permease